MLSHAQSSIRRPSSQNTHGSPSTASIEVHPGSLDQPGSADGTPMFMPRTPSSTYRVYNDLQPAASQPDTPADLPEERHRSRYHPSYTAPINRTASHLLNTASPIARRPVYASPSSRISQRSTERFGGRILLNGINRPGFDGLYGGRENGDEDGTWVDGAHSSRLGRDSTTSTRQHGLS